MEISRRKFVTTPLPELDEEAAFSSFDYLKHRMDIGLDQRCWSQLLFTLVSAALENSVAASCNVVGVTLKFQIKVL
jgi:hypothetical protein